MNKLNFPDYDSFSEKTKGIKQGHWVSQPVQSRWDYHSRVINLIKSLDIDDPSRVLEMGTVGVQCVIGSHTIDFAEAWNYPGKSPNYMHDARQIPWPIQDKQYDLFVALRVFQHLAPKQKECVQEAMRIADKVIIVSPLQYNIELYPNSKGINYSDFVGYLDGIHPNLFIHTSMGFLYYWDTKNPSHINLENVVLPIVEKATPKAKPAVETPVAVEQTILTRAKNKLSRMLKGNG